MYPEHATTGHKVGTLLGLANYALGSFVPSAEVLLASGVGRSAPGHARATENGARDDPKA